MRRNGDKKNIFVVDNDPAVRTTLDFHLAEAGYSVTLCASDGDLFEMMEQSRFDLFITDIRMPEISGIGGLDYLKSNHKTSPVIVLTGTNEVDTARHVMKNGVFDYLKKPITEEDLLTMVQRALAPR